MNILPKFLPIYLSQTRTLFYGYNLPENVDNWMVKFGKECATINIFSIKVHFMGLFGHTYHFLL